MTISKDLFLAILAMDSYNRGYNAGIADGGQDDTDGLGDSVGTLIGSATVTAASRSDPDSAEVAAGFYAVAYTIGAGVDGITPGTTVISYRGTDSTPTADSLTDATRGWPLGGGGYFSPQTALANAILDAVQPDNARGSVILTGHSLGGGLAA